MMNSYSVAERINSQVNASVTYKTDLEQFGVPEFWCEARSGFDDCDGYALLKRALLKEQGFDEDKIHIATCWINVKAIDTGHCSFKLFFNALCFIVVCRVHTFSSLYWCLFSAIA